MSNLAKPSNKLTKKVIIGMISGVFGAIVGAFPISILKLIIMVNENLSPLCTVLTDDSNDLILTTCGILIVPSFHNYLFWVYIGLNLFGGAFFGFIGALVGHSLFSRLTEKQFWPSFISGALSFIAGSVFDLLFVFYFLWPGY